MAYTVSGCALIKKIHKPFDLDSVLQCLFHCPILYQNVSKNNKLNDNTILHKFIFLLKKYYTCSNLSDIQQYHELASLIVQLKPELNISPDYRTENTVSELINFLSITLNNSNDKQISTLINGQFSSKSFTILSLPIPRSTMTIIITVINMQLHADFNQYNVAKTNISLISIINGYIRQISTNKHIPSDIKQIISNYIDKVFKPTKYYFELPSDSRIIDIKVQLEKLTKIPRQKYVLSQHDKTEPLNQWSSIYDTGDKITNVDEIPDSYYSDPTIDKVGYYDIICYIHPSAAEMKQVSYFKNAKQFGQQMIFHEELDQVWKDKYSEDIYRRFGIGFFIRIPIGFDVSVSYIIHTIHEMLKPHMKGHEADKPLSYKLVMYHRLHYRFPWADCKYEGGEGGMGCHGCELEEYMAKYGVIQFKRSDLRCFGIRWNLGKETLFDHDAFKTPIHDISMGEKYESFDTLSLFEKQRDVTVYDCFDAFIKEQEGIQERKLSIEKLPRVLILKLEKFIKGSKFKYKYRNNELVVAPLSGLDLKKYVVENDDEKGDVEYNLFATLVHAAGYGTQNGYHAYCKNFNDCNWYKFHTGSEKIDKVDFSSKWEVGKITESADILFYVRS